MQLDCADFVRALRRTLQTQNTLVVLDPTMTVDDMSIAQNTTGMEPVIVTVTIMKEVLVHRVGEEETRNDVLCVTCSRLVVDAVQMGKT